MGLTAVKLRTGGDDPDSSAIAYTDSDICNILIDPHDPERLEIDRILLKDQFEVSSQLRPIAACAVVPKNRYPPASELAGSLVYFSDDVCHIQEVTKKKVTIPRRLRLESTPRQIIFCDWLRMFVVAGTQNNIQQFRSNNARKNFAEIRRITRGILEFVRPGTPSFASNTPRGKDDPSTIVRCNQQCGSFKLLRGECIFALTQWTHQKDQGIRYSFILVGTGRSDARSPRKGRLLFIKATIEHAGNVSCKIQKSIPHSGPVRCVAVFQRNFFICGVGKSLKVYAHEEQK